MDNYWGKKTMTDLTIHNKNNYFNHHYNYGNINSIQSYPYSYYNYNFIIIILSWFYYNCFVFGFF